MIVTLFEEYMATRNRRYGSLATELIKKAREAMLSAVQIYNNPQIDFKSELFIVTAVIAWTYLLHAYFRKKGIDYRMTDSRRGGTRRKFLRTQRGAVRHLSLEDCLGHDACPLDGIVRKTLLFLIGIRHEIEHQMTTRVDQHLSAKFMAAALNFNSTLKKHFGPNFSLEKEQAFSIQFTSIDQATARMLFEQKELPQHIAAFIVQFERTLSQEEYDDPRFSYRVALVPRTGNRATTADGVFEIVPPGSETAEAIGKVLLKETERTKYRPKSIVQLMRAEGFIKFNIHSHTELWQAKDAKNPKHQYGVEVEGAWFWYASWLPVVRSHCQENAQRYRTEHAAAQAAS